MLGFHTSGNIGQGEFDSFISEARSVFLVCRPDRFALAQCDHHSLQASNERLALSPTLSPTFSLL
jgi:hypothetical protein